MDADLEHGTGGGDQSRPQKKKCTKEALQIAEERREVKSKKERERLYPTECRVPENSKER